MKLSNMWSRKKLFVAVVTIVPVVYIIMTNYNLNFNEAFGSYGTTETSFEYLETQLSENNTTVCHFPDLDPWHPSLAAYIVNGTVPHASCPQTQPELTYVDMQGFLFFNQSALDIFIDELIENGTNAKIDCFYWTFDRASGEDDNEVRYSPKRSLTNETSPVALDEDMVKVICYRNESENDTIYWNLHAHPANKSDRRFSSPTDTQLSVLMLGMDGVSNSEFRRRMLQTLDYITNKMGMHMFKKMNKVGENSYTNLIPLLTGQRADDEQDDMSNELKNSTYYDSAPLIWHYFADKGYATSFNEDWPRTSIFHYYPDIMKGFLKKPFDYYYHMFWLVYDRNLDRFCIGNKPTGEAHVDITRRHMITMNDTLQFAFHFLTDCSHNQGDDVNKCDEVYLNFFKETFEGSYLNKTVVFFFSDHGPRHQDIRKTFIGSLEEHNPFFGLWFPEWFHKQHPHLKKVLQQNMDKYTSTYDIHETLKDILNEDFDTVQQRPEAKRGLSLLRNLPKNRLCKEASVPDRFCLCKEEISLEISSPVVNDAAHYVITMLNALLEPLSTKCEKIELSSVLGATSVSFDQNWDQGNDHLNKMRLILLTKPNNALFEAFLGKSLKSTNGKLEWALLGEIERISQYGKSANCIEDRWMKKFCTCIKI